MCKNCKSIPLGIERQQKLDAAIAECQQLNVNPGTAGFIARHAMRGSRLPLTTEQQAAITNYNTAQSLMKSLHNDYIFEQARQHAQERLERKRASERDRLLEYAIAFDANDHETMAAIHSSGDEALDAAIATLHKNFDGERTMCEYLRAMRGGN